MKKVLITGGTGMIGSALTEKLIDEGFSVIILTRSLENKQQKKEVSYALWDPEKLQIDIDAVQSADYVVHLAGANVAEKRWTTKRKQEIIDSRVKTGNLIAKALLENENKVNAVISISGIGWYGDSAAEFSLNEKHSYFNETAPPANDFLATTCQQWEAAIKPVEEFGTRLIIFRSGIVLSKKGGAYVEFVKPFQFRVGTILGSGKQIVSWIHIDDLVSLFMEAINNDALEGIYNAVAPQPVTNEQLIKTIGKEKGGKYFYTHVPEIALKAAIGEMSVEVLKSAAVSSKKIQEEGYEFKYPTLEKAIPQLEE